MPVLVDVKCDGVTCDVRASLDGYNGGERPPGWLFQRVDERYYERGEDDRLIITPKYFELSFCPSCAEKFAVRR